MEIKLGCRGSSRYLWEIKLRCQCGREVLMQKKKKFVSRGFLQLRVRPILGLRSGQGSRGLDPSLRRVAGAARPPCCQIDTAGRRQPSRRMRQYIQIVAVALIVAASTVCGADSDGVPARSVSTHSLAALSSGCSSLRCSSFCCSFVWLFIY